MEFIRTLLEQQPMLTLFLLAPIVLACAGAATGSSCARYT
jgi:hypothetical protein